MSLMIAHIAGIPIEESLVMAVPVVGAMYVALMASFRSRRPGKGADPKRD